MDGNGRPIPEEAPTRLTPLSGCLLSLLLGLLGVGAVILAGTLATSGELVWRRGELLETRLWLVNDPGNQGLAFSNDRVTRQEDASQRCVTTRVRFLLWRAEAPAAIDEFCACYTRVDPGWEYAGACTP